jgi:hypothetical protein
VWRAGNLDSKAACLDFCLARQEQLAGSPHWHSEALSPDGRLLFVHFQNVLMARDSGNLVGLSSGILVHCFDDQQRIRRTLKFRGPTSLAERAQVCLCWGKHTAVLSCVQQHRAWVGLSVHLGVDRVPLCCSHHQLGTTRAAACCPTVFPYGWRRVWTREGRQPGRGRRSLRWRPVTRLNSEGLGVRDAGVFLHCITQSRASGGVVVGGSPE